MKKNYFFLVFALFLLQFSYSQINYSCDMNPSGCGSDWDNNGWADYASSSWACGDYSIYDNSWDDDTILLAYNNSYITGHQGGAITISFKVQLKAYESPYGDETDEWGNLKLFYKTSALTTETMSDGIQIGSTVTSASACETLSFTLTPGQTLNQIVFAIQYNYGSGDNYLVIEDFSAVEEVSSPAISVGSAISNLNYISGAGPSTSQSTTVSGSNLEADITLTAPTNFEISTDNTNFSDSKTLSHSGGTVGSTTIHARLKSGLSPGSYSGNITASSTNATSQTISLSGLIQHSSTTLYIDDSGDDNNNTGLSAESPYATLSNAINLSQDGVGVTINVGAGTYTEHSLSLSKSNITIKGAGSSSTFFTSNTTNKGFMSITGDNNAISDLKISSYNFTSASNTANAYGGAALRIGAPYGTTSTSASTVVTGLTISDVIFYQNKTAASSADGGAISFVSNDTGSDQTATISNCTFDGNIAGDYDNSTVSNTVNGGAIVIKDGNNININNSLFYDNRSMGYGGAITVGHYVNYVPTLTVKNSLFYRNRYHYDSSANAGIYVTWSNLNLYNSFVNYSFYRETNTVNDVGGNADSNFIIKSSFLTLFDETLMDESDSTTTNNEGEWPKFTDAENDDFTLLFDSPAIGQGNATFAPGTDINGVTRPQGSADDVGPYEYRNTWTGGSNTTDWGTAGNWDQGYVPTASTESPIIADVTHQPIISSDDGSSGHVSLKDITINSGATLTINKESSLSLSGDFTNSGTVTLNSGLVSGSDPATSSFSSLIVEGNSTGDIIYNRYVNVAVDNGSNEWDLVGSPVDGLSISSFVGTNSSVIATSGSTYALGYHDNSDDSWTNYTDNTGSNDVASAGNFPLGKGYQMATTSGATMAFTGTVATSTQTQSVVNNHNNGGRRWNLVANPFPSYINLNDNNDASNNFLTVNTDSGVINGSGDFVAVYGYDADGTGYSIYNHAGSSTRDYIAPGQAFFIAAASASAANISFTPAMRTTSGGDDFVSGRLAQSTWSNFYLRLYEDDNFTSDTQLYFEQGLSLGLDPGYDAGALNQSDDIVSRLSEEDQGIGMAINAMGLSALDEETVVPLVLNRDAGVEFSISFEDSTIPEDVGIYLEDTLLETLTDLRSSDFTLTPESDLSNMGRFYLRIGNTSLGGNDLDESYISIYKAASDDFVTIEGLSNVEKANVQLFNIIGQEVLNTTLNSNQSTQRVSTSGLTTGVYVIRLQADSSVIAKKIIIN